MSIFDIIVVAILALAAVLGFFKGVVKSLLRFAEVIIVLGLSALAAMAMVWLKITDLDKVNAAISAADVNAIMDSGALFFLIAFVVTFIVGVIVFDYVLNRIVYSRKVKSILIDRCVGLVLNLIFTAVILMFVFAVISSLEGTEYDIYVTVTEGSSIVPLLIDYNPLREPIKNLLIENGITKILIAILNMFWPNFEYLAMI